MQHLRFFPPVVSLISWLLLRLLYVGTATLYLSTSMAQTNDLVNNPYRTVFTCGDGNPYTPFSQNPPAYYAPYGGVFTPKGDLKLLVIYAGFENDAGQQDLTGWTDSMGLPTVTPLYTMEPGGIAKKLFYRTLSDFSTYAGDGTVQSLSKYYYEMSRGSFRLMGEMLRDPTTGNPIRINIDPSGVASWADCNRKVMEKMLTLYPAFDWSPYDTRTNKPYYQFDNSISSPDYKPDYVVIIYRYSPYWTQQPKSGMQYWPGSGGGYAALNGLNGFTYNGYTFDGAGFTFCAGGQDPKALFLHEVAHTLFDAPHYSGANRICGNHFYMNGGWGMMNIGMAPFDAALGWERWYLDWISLTTGSTQISSDINTPADLSTTNGVFTLRDFITTGDVVRIHIPGGSGAAQYLWLENHQGLSVFDNRSWTHDGKGLPFPSSPRGLVAYVEAINGNKSVVNIFQNGANGIRPVHPAGNYDFSHPPQHVCPNPDNFWQNRVYLFSESAANPIAGQHRMQYIRDDYNDFPWTGTACPGSNPPDGQIRYDNNTNGLSFENEQFSVLNRNNVFTYDVLGSDLAWPAGKKAGTGYNPAINNYPFYNNTSAQLEPIYLNGISVEVLGYNISGEVTIKVRLDEFDVKQDQRICGEVILPPNTLTVSPNYAINVFPGVTLSIDKSGSPNRHTQAITGDFINPTRLTCQNGSILHLENTATLIVNNGSTLALQSGSSLQLENGAMVIVKNGARLMLESGSSIIVNGSSQVLIEPNGFLEYHGNSTVSLNNSNSILEIQGSLHLGDSADFSVTSSGSERGFVRFNAPTPDPWAPTRNITAGTGARMSFTGTSKNQKVLEVLQETLYAPDHLLGFSLVNGTAALGSNARLQPPASPQAEVLLLNARITSASGSYNAHRGVQLYGQPGVYIAACTFEYGLLGLQSFQTYGGGSLSLHGCDFRYNNTGLYLYDKGVKVTGCSFNNNGVDESSLGALAADHMAFPSYTGQSVFGGTSAKANRLGVFYSGSTSAPLRMNHTEVSFNYHGITTQGTMLSVRCGSVKHNTCVGIAFHTLSAVNMSSLLGSGYTDASENLKTLRPDCASFLLLSEGYNNLKPALSSGSTSCFSIPSLNIPRVVDGSIYLLPGASYIDARHNHWNTAGTAPLSGNDYQLQDCSTWSPVTIADSDPTSYTGCPVVPAPPLAIPGSADPLVSCASCPYLTTASFHHIRLHDAVRAMAYATSRDTMTSALTLFSRWNELFTYPIQPVTTEIKYLLSLARHYMLQSLGAAYARRELPQQQVTPALLQAVSILSNALSGASMQSYTAANDYPERLAVSMDRALLYRTAGFRDTAIQLLDSMLTWVMNGEYGMVTRWRCAVELERQVLSGQLPKEEFMIHYTACGGQSMNKTAAVYNAPEPSATVKAQQDTLTNTVSLYPNPATGTLFLDIVLPEQDRGTVEVTDLSGKTVLRLPDRLLDKGTNRLELRTDQLPAGTYLVKLLTSSSSSIHKITLIH